ncbi:MAG: penicillin acylase family protein [Myxococcales bacterium]|nr:penicillin acylase family protein [Myxococcales bacterium]
MLRRIGQVLACILVLVLITSGWVWLRARASLPRLEGELALGGLANPVTVARDSRGIPVISASSLEDALRAQGFVHAQDRYFQMDLNRRATAGELAALFGNKALEADERLRKRQRRHAARALLDGLDSATRRWLEMYAEGVNAGLADLGAAPPEYLILRAEPDPWLPEDTLLATLGFFDMLSFNHRMEKPLGVMAATLPEALLDFLTPSTSRWDAPLIESPEGSYRPAVIPGPEVLDLRGVEPESRQTSDPARDYIRPVGMALGSNNWAVAADRSAHGGAVLANDPHLGLRVPHVWHRVQFELPGRRIVGVGAPGLPGVVIGSNGAVAWGATNSFADQTDLIVVEVDPEDPGRYLTPEGSEFFETRLETLRVKGGDDIELEVRWTRWGPVTDEDWLGRPLVVRSPIHDDGGLNFDLLGMMRTSSFDDAVELLAGWRGPSQNWLLAAADGRIGWVVNGPIPRRVGFDGKDPRSWVTPGIGWFGERPGPQLVEPPERVLYTANGRTVPDPLSHVWMHSGRTHRIRERLAERETWDEVGLREIQLDVRSRYHDEFADLVLEVVSAEEADPTLRSFRETVAGWDGTAGIDQSGFVAVARFAEAVVDGVLEPLLAPAARADEDFVYDWALADEPVRRILEERPEHLVPPPHADWTAFLRSVVERLASDLAAAPRGLDRTWGEARPVTIRHPLGSLPVLGGYLNMPATPLPGWAGTVRAQTASYGASMRLVVSPGKEELGMLHMPAGQSGHFMSPHYADQQDAWVRGLPTPLLAGEAATVLRLVPGG